LATSDHEGDRSGEEQDRDAMRPAPDERVQNVPAVQLSDRHQVERRHEDSDPTGKQPSVLDNDVMLGDGSKVKALKPLDDQWEAIALASQSWIEIADLGPGQPD
jgi:hypothetical protein